MRIGQSKKRIQTDCKQIGQSKVRCLKATPSTQRAYFPYAQKNFHGEAKLVKQRLKLDSHKIWRVLREIGQVLNNFLYFD